VSEPLEAELPRERSCTAVARRLVEQEYAGVLGVPTLQDLKLVVSEIVDNAYVHGRGRIRLKLEQKPASIRVEVTDEGEDAAVRIRHLGARGGGHGLRLVDHLCASWGSFTGSTRVWCELPLAPQ
jgi:anti-sigma regulatory factor (Ser/Thr protein kinase)